MPAASLALLQAALEPLVEPAEYWLPDLGPEAAQELVMDRWSGPVQALVSLQPAG